MVLRLSYSCCHWSRLNSRDDRRTLLGGQNARRHCMARAMVQARLYQLLPVRVLFKAKADVTTTETIFLAEPSARLGHRNTFLTTKDDVRYVNPHNKLYLLNPQKKLYFLLRNKRKKRHVSCAGLKPPRVFSLCQTITIARTGYGAAILEKRTSLRSRRISPSI